MPRYDFKCKCGKEFDKVVTIGKSKTQCECGKYAVKQLSPPSYILKGSGFCRTDAYKEDRSKSVTRDIGRMKPWQWYTLYDIN